MLVIKEYILRKILYILKRLKESPVMLKEI